MTLLQELFYLNEGIHDKGIFKAVFILGGPASGKTTLAKSIQKNMPDFGIKILDNDVLYTHLGTKHDLDLSKEGPKKIQAIAYKMGVEKHMIQQPLWMHGMLPLVVLGVSDKPEKIINRINYLRNIGYDIRVIYIKTMDIEKTINAEIEREKKEGRGVPKSYIKSVFDKQEEAISKLSNYTSVSVIPDFAHRKEDETHHMVDVIKKFFSSDVMNPVGKKAMAELTSKGKVLGDIGTAVGTIQQNWKELRK